MPDSCTWHGLRFVGAAIAPSGERDSIVIYVVPADSLKRVALLQAKVTRSLRVGTDIAAGGWLESADVLNALEYRGESLLTILDDGTDAPL